VPSLWVERHQHSELNLRPNSHLEYLVVVVAPPSLGVALRHLADCLGKLLNSNQIAASSALEVRGLHLARNSCLLLLSFSILMEI
jgi:hypothetical protein